MNIGMERDAIAGQTSQESFPLFVITGLRPGDPRLFNNVLAEAWMAGSGPGHDEKESGCRQSALTG
jgi:hypothetical protein